MDFILYSRREVEESKMIEVCGRILLVGCLVLVPAMARAEPTTPEKQGGTEDEVDTEHIFGFAEGSDIGKKGEREIENVNIGSFGKAAGAYNNVDTEVSFRYGVTDRLRLSIGTLTDYYAIESVPTFTNRTATTFSGVIGEARYNLVNDAMQSYGLSLSFNPAYRQFDPTSGAQENNYAFPLTLLFNKTLIPDKFYAAVNLVYTPAFFTIPGGASGTEHDNGFAAIAAATFAVSKTIFVGAEIRQEVLVQSTAPTAHALFLGPTLFYRFSPTFNAKVTYEAQVPDPGSRSLDLQTYTRHQVELQFAYNF